MTEAVTEPLRRSPLHDRHRACGATMTGFAGWDMPLDYGSVVTEHRAVREQCGVFDLSHLGTLRITGGRALETVQRAFSNDAAALAPGRAQYTLCLDERGGITDDLLLYRLAGGFFAVPNAANAAAVAGALRRSAEAVDGTDVTDMKDHLACLAIQGPRAPEVAAAAGLPVEGMAYLDCAELPVPGGGADLQVLARSGYTGERGFEVFLAADRAPALWDRLLELRAVPAGLGARDTLRLEMGYPLHGNDISPQTSPVEAGLGWAVKPDTEFVGRDAYLGAKQAGPGRRLRGLRALGRGIPRAHCRVTADGAGVGEVTSGTFSPTLRLGIALAYLDASVALGERVDIDVRGKSLLAEVVRPPFVESDPRS